MAGRKQISGDLGDARKVGISLTPETHAILTELKVQLEAVTQPFAALRAELQAEQSLKDTEASIHLFQTLIPQQVDEAAKAQLEAMLKKFQTKRSRMKPRKKSMLLGYTTETNTFEVFSREYASTSNIIRYAIRKLCGSSDPKVVEKYIKDLVNDQNELKIFMNKD